MRQVFERYTPSVVFHAAAYKHVPLMEANPLESVRNNTLATKVIAEVAVEFGVERFVLVSTDKAVNPKTVMGQSKALCEWIVEAYGARRDVTTRFVAVRFGNVLGSSGSVIPIFRRQIERGGPVGGHAPGDDAVLHDDPGGGLADRPGRLDRRPRPGVRARHGRAGVDRRPREEHDPALRQGARPRHRDRVRRRPARREAARGAVGRRRDGRRRHRTRRSSPSRGRRSTRRGSRTSWPSWSGWSPTARRSSSSRGSAAMMKEPRRVGRRRRRRPRRLTGARGSRRAGRARRLGLAIGLIFLAGLVAAALDLQFVIGGSPVGRAGRSRPRSPAGSSLARVEPDDSAIASARRRLRRGRRAGRPVRPADVRAAALGRDVPTVVRGAGLRLDGRRRTANQLIGDRTRSTGAIVRDRDRRRRAGRGRGRLRRRLGRELRATARSRAFRPRQRKSRDDRPGRPAVGDRDRRRRRLGAEQAEPAG